MEAFFAHIRAENPGFTMSTGRQYQNGLRMFMDFICDARYGLPCFRVRPGMAAARGRQATAQRNALAYGGASGSSGQSSHPGGVIRARDYTTTHPVQGVRTPGRAGDLRASAAKRTDNAA